MSDPTAQAEAFTEIRGQIIRADGTVIDLGVIDARYRNPVRQALWTHVRKPLADRRIRNANRTVNQEG